MFFGTRALSVIIVLYLGAGILGAQAQSILVINHVTVVDTMTGRTLASTKVTISGEVISSLAADAPLSTDATVVDGQGKFLIPGLWDMHAHHEGTGEVSLQLYVANGVTGTRDMGSALDFILRLRRVVASGDTLGPRIVAAGPILDDAPADWPFRLSVRTVEEGRNAVRMLKARGVDFVKVHDRTPRDVYFAMADEAKRLNLPLVGHVPRGVTSRRWRMQGSEASSTWPGSDCSGNALRARTTVRSSAKHSLSGLRNAAFGRRRPWLPGGTL